jgi:hypothetical protein
MALTRIGITMRETPHASKEAKLAALEEPLGSLQQMFKRLLPLVLVLLIVVSITSFQVCFGWSSVDNAAEVFRSWVRALLPRT